MAPTDCNPARPPVPLKFAEAPSRLAAEPRPMLCMPPPPPPPRPWPAVLAATARAERSRSAAARTIVDRQMNLVLTLAARDHVEVAGLLGLEQVDRLGRHGRPSADEGSESTAVRRLLWAVAIGPREQSSH